MSDRQAAARSPRHWTDRLLLAALVVGLLMVAVRGGFASLPLFVDNEPPGSVGAPVAAVLLSGDLGLAAGLGGRVATRLARAGIPTIGINAPAYFLSQRSPDDVAAVVEVAARRVLAGRPAARLVLIGHSFGADVLPAGVNRLPPDLRRRLALVMLTVPGRAAYYRISLGEFFGFARPDADPAIEARLIEVPTLCIHGARERQSLCARIRGPGVRDVGLAGGHHLKNDPGPLVATILQAIDGIRMTKA